MKTFKEWLNTKENLYMGRPHGPMGPDGRIYGHSNGPVEQVPGSGTWRSSPVSTGRQFSPPPVPVLNNNQDESEGLWKANGPRIRLAYLWKIPNAEQLNLHNMDWKDLPPEAKEAASKEMDSKSPFG